MKQQQSVKGSLGKQRIDTRPRVHTFTSIHPPVHALHQLQRSIGNRAVGRLLQTRLKVSQPRDQYEIEADSVADQVLRIEEPGTAQPTVPGRSQVPHLQGECPKYEEKKPLTAIEAACRRAGVLSAPGVSNQGLIGGDSLPAETLAFFNQRFGYHFGNVRIHDDEQAHREAANLGAQAFTIGQNIAFGSGYFKPGTPNGNRLLAHELAHVMQQTTTGAAGVPGHAASTQTISERAAPNVTMAEPAIQRAPLDPQALVSQIQGKLESARSRSFGSRAQSDVHDALVLIATVPEGALDSLLKILDVSRLTDVIFQHLGSDDRESRVDLLDRIRVHRTSSMSLLAADPQFKICNKPGGGLDSRPLPKPEDGIWTNSGDVNSVKVLVDGIREAFRFANGRVAKLGILAHGDVEGVVNLGGDRLNADTYDRYEPQLRSIERYIAPNADIILYGCISGAGLSGTRLLRRLSSTFPGRRIIGFNVIQVFNPEAPSRTENRSVCFDPSLFVSRTPVRTDLDPPKAGRRNPEREWVFNNKISPTAESVYAKILRDSNVEKWPELNIRQKDQRLGETHETPRRDDEAFAPLPAPPGYRSAPHTR